MKGRTFREYRRFFGFTIKEIASILTVTEKTINNWESGTTDVPAGPVVFFKEQISNLEVCLLFFHSETSREYIPFCKSVHDVHFFYPDIIHLKKLHHQIYAHAIVHYSLRLEKDLNNLTIDAYKLWCKEFGLDDTSLESRSQYRGFVSTGGDILNRSKKNLPRPVQYHLL